MVAIAGLIFWGCSKDNPTATTSNGCITGCVTDTATGLGIYGVTITTNPATSAVSTDTSGYYSISGVVPGTYAVTARKTGYSANTGNATVIEDNTTTINIALTVITMTIEWVSIPAGSFEMGRTAVDTILWLYSSDEYPLHTVYLDGYQISKYEITNAQYMAFMDAGGYSNSIYWTTEGWNWRTTCNRTEPTYWSLLFYSGGVVYNSGPTFPNYPVVGVTWYEAYAFCNWAGGHLPTEAQWEKAARGTDSTNCWPWGRTWNAANCNSYYNASPDTFGWSSPVGYFNLGQSPYGVYDMAGNVRDWVNDWYDSTYYDVSPTSNPTGPASGGCRIIRGGGWDCREVKVGYCFRTAYRSPYTPIAVYHDLGFRIAR
jgi:formylglycine-generating enzyme required for sulfatase activity